MHPPVSTQYQAIWYLNSNDQIFFLVEIFFPVTMSCWNEVIVWGTLKYYYWSLVARCPVAVYGNTLRIFPSTDQLLSDQVRPSNQLLSIFWLISPDTESVSWLGPLIRVHIPSNITVLLLTLAHSIQDIIHDVDIIIDTPSLPHSHSALFPLYTWYLSLKCP